MVVIEEQGWKLTNLILWHVILSIEMNSYVIIGMATMLTLTLVAAITTTTAVFADRTSGENTADARVHETPDDFGGLQDRSFHEGTCQGGSTSVACGFDIITEPGESDEHRQDN